MGSERFEAAMSLLRGQSTLGNSQLADPFVDVFSVTGVAVSTLGSLLGSETIAASDRMSEKLDELQFDLGEGPCWDAMRADLPVLEPELRAGSARTWPAFSRAIENENVSAIFAFPLRLGPLQIGAIDMYSTLPAMLDTAQCDWATAMADVVGRTILRRALADADALDSGGISRFSRRTVHQATGMVLAQLGVSAEDAMLVIQGYAYATDQSMMDVAHDILTRRLSFSQTDGSIEESE